MPGIIFPYVIHAPIFLTEYFIHSLKRFVSPTFYLLLPDNVLGFFFLLFFSDNVCTTSLRHRSKQKKTFTNFYQLFSTPSVVSFIKPIVSFIKAT